MFILKLKSTLRPKLRICHVIGQRSKVTSCSNPPSHRGLRDKCASKFRIKLPAIEHTSFPESPFRFSRLQNGRASGLNRNTNSELGISKKLERCLRAHIVLVAQYSNISQVVYASFEQRKKECPSFVAPSRPLRDFLEVLDYYLFNTEGVQEPLPSDPKFELVAMWKNEHQRLVEWSRKLHQVLPSEATKIDSSTCWVPINSLLELGIQCYLDSFPHFQNEEFGILISPFLGIFG